MKNKILNIALAISLLFSAACNDDFLELDKKPLNIISDAFVFEDQALVDAYMANMYEKGLHFYAGIFDPVMWTMDEGMGAVCRNIAAWQAPTSFPLQVIDENGSGLIHYWPYETVRFINTFIEGMKGSGLPEDFRKTVIAEAKCLRANVYLNMVKRYGGVPIITTPQAEDASDEELYVARNSEKEVYDFIATQLDEAIADLPETSVTGRLNKFSALAIKSRAMVYAASVAQFGDVQLNGLLGIPTAEANTYWQKAYDASKAIINSGNYALYNAKADAAQNFQDLFVDESGANKEPILSVVFDPALGKGHSWNVGAVPFEFRAIWGSNYHAFLNIVEEFEYKDGTSGAIDRDLINGDHLFSLDELFLNRDPRFLATFFFPGSQWQGGTVHLHSGTYVDGELKTAGTIGDSWPAIAPKRNIKGTGIMVRKRMDEGEIKPLKGTSDEDYHLYRYAEILLNAAEAAFYLNKGEEAKTLVNQVRERAGMPAVAEATENAIRHERTVELVFEDHRYWDLRRWRTAHQFLDGLETKGLKFFYYFNEDKYDLQLIKGESSTRVFQQRHYYLPLGVNLIADNPNLVENPGY